MSHFQDGSPPPLPLRPIPVLDLSSESASAEGKGPANLFVSIFRDHRIAWSFAAVSAVVAGVVIFRLLTAREPISTNDDTPVVDVADAKAFAEAARRRHNEPIFQRVRAWIERGRHGRYSFLKSYEWEYDTTPFRMNQHPVDSQVHSLVVMLLRVLDSEAYREDPEIKAVLADLEKWRYAKP